MMRKGRPAKEEEGGLRARISEVNLMRGLKLTILFLLVAACVAAIVPLFALESRIPLISIPVAAVLLFSMVMKVFIVQDFYKKIPWYVLDALLLLALSVLGGWWVPSVVVGTSYTYFVYVVVLSEFYLSSPSLRDNAIMFGVNLAAYTAVYIAAALGNDEFSNAFSISSQYFVALIVFALHFVVFNFAMTVYRKNRQIEQNLRELEESRNELLHAYDKLEEATLLEERNRIAKEIHDTAGHSLTTVIMQTEAARLAIDRDPAGAKRSIAAANLQAKNCLEELRLSVHLLSGRRENVTLKEYLEGILEETGSGTGLTFRCKIDDIELTYEAERFISNTLREGISNGVRHGGSTAFLFELKDMGSYIEFLLSDNGSGADMKTFKEGFGLSAMRAKAESLGGMVHLSSETGEGFEIRLSLPASLKKQKEEKA